MKDFRSDHIFERRQPPPPSTPLSLGKDFLLKYRKTVDETIAFRTIILTAIGLVLHLALNALDLVMYPAYASLFLLFRAVIVPPSLLICLPNFFKKTKKFSIWTIDAIVLLHIATLCAMIYVSNGASSNYFAGINLTLLGMTIVNGFYFWHSLGVCLISLAMYLAAAIGNQTGFDLPKLIVAGTLMSATGIFAGLLTKFYSISYFKAFVMNERLQEDDRKLTALYHVAEERSKIDDLTKSYNRRFFFEILSSKIANCSMAESFFYLIIFDIDHLKQINDTYGHVFGDEVIAGVARVVNEGMRANSYLGRYGGDEFMLIIDRATTEEFLVRAKAIQAKIQDMKLTFGGNPIKITASFGAARFDPAQGMDEKKLIDLADGALFEVKRSKRGEIKLANPVA